MGKLCERPGCSENAALAYGMRTEELVFWLDVLRDSTTQAGGVLCQRHGDSMVVPRGWTLDDLRDPDLHLFRPPTVEPDVAPTRTRRARPSGAGSDDTQQLELRGLGAAVREPEAEVPRVESTGSGATATDEADDRWTPSFDASDDLGGLLAARGPLLSRAFRGAGRPD